MWDRPAYWNPRKSTGSNRHAHEMSRNFESTKMGHRPMASLLSHGDRTLWEMAAENNNKLYCWAKDKNEDAGRSLRGRYRH